MRISKVGRWVLGWSLLGGLAPAQVLGVNPLTGLPDLIGSSVSVLAGTGAVVVQGGGAYTVSVDGVVVPSYSVGSGAPSGTCTQGRDFYVDSIAQALYVCVAADTWVKVLAGTVGIANGGTGGTTKSAGFDALSPMTAAGDIIYGGTGGTGTRLAKGTAGQVLTMNSGATAPEWAAPSGGGSGFDPLDLNTVWLRESFSNYTSVDGKFGDGLGWEYAAIAGSCTLGQVSSGARPGVLSISTSATANDACDVRPRGTGGTWTDASQAGWTLRITWRGATLGSSSTFRAGLHDSHANANAVGVRRDTSQSDSNIFYEVIAGSSGSAYDSGVDCGASDYCTVQIRAIEAGKVGMKISKNGGAWSTEYTFCPSGCTVTKTIATTSYIPFFQVKTLTNATRTIYLDEVAFVQTVANHP